MVLGRSRHERTRISSNTMILCTPISHQPIPLDQGALPERSTTRSGNIFIEATPGSSDPIAQGGVLKERGPCSGERPHTW
eukprot:scaffold967_cov321-Pavlova_lutheri.AAC.31